MSMIKRLAMHFLSHRRRYYLDRISRRVSTKALTTFLDELGVRPGMVLYVQSSFGCLGYYPPGPQGAVRALQSLLGPSGTLVMPSFPFSGTMADFVSGRPIFDVRGTPSRIGAFPEALRHSADAIRSVHPTHPVVATGRFAHEIVEGHELTSTPQGPDSPFAKMVSLDGWILRVGAGAYPFCHHLQELVDYPNLFLPEPIQLECVLDDGQSRAVETKVYRPTLPFVFFRDGGMSGDPVATNLVDFPYLHCGERESVMRARPDCASVLEEALKVRMEAKGNGGLSSASLNACECDLFPIRSSLEFSVRVAQDLIDKHRAFYDPESLTAALADGSVLV